MPISRHIVNSGTVPCATIEPLKDFFSSLNTISHNPPSYIFTMNFTSFGWRSSNTPRRGAGRKQVSIVYNPVTQDIIRGPLRARIRTENACHVTCQLSVLEISLHSWARLLTDPLRGQAFYGGCLAGRFFRSHNRPEVKRRRI